MNSGYVKFAFLALSTVLLANVALGVWNYSDVDLRIAERKAIPHYIRHSYEYPDIDIKKIMQQRGIPIPSQNSRPQHSAPNFNRGTYVHQQGNAVNNAAWRSHGKSVALSNHIIPFRDVYIKKKDKYNRNFLVDGKSKLKNRFH